MAGYAELHCHTNFSFLDGASHPEELAVEAARLGLAGLAVTDHDGLYGVVRFALAAREHGLPTVFGAEMTLGITRPANGEPDPEGEHLLVLAEGPVGYARLARAISEAQMAGEKGAPRTTIDALARDARAPVHLHPQASARNDSWYVLTGCRKGTVPAALVRDGPTAARDALDRLVAGFGRDRVLVELWDHGDPIDRHRNDALARVAMAAGVDVVATNNVHYATPAQRPLAIGARGGAVASFARRDRRLAPRRPVRAPPQRGGAGASLRPLAGRGGAHGRRRSRLRVRPPARGARAPRSRRARRSHRDDVAARAHRPRRARPVPVDPSEARGGDAPDRTRARRDRAAQLPRLLPRARRHRRVLPHARHLLPGAGSAANSAVCYALGVTQADAVTLGLLFERFLSLERDGPPDIDLDIEHQRREEVIQYVYDKYGHASAPRRSPT